MQPLKRKLVNKRDEYKGGINMKFGWKVALVSIILVLVTGGGVLAAVLLKSLPAQVNIVAGNKSVEVYSDFALTQVMSSINFGDVQPGFSSSQIVLYIKNTGGQSMSVIVQKTDDISGWGALSIFPSTSFYLAPGSSGTATLQLSTSPIALGGVKSFTVTISEP